MKPVVYSVHQQLEKAKERQFVHALETESLNVACQKFDGLHSFRHLNREHDEIWYVISGELEAWTEKGKYSLKAGDLIKVPKGIEHGDLVGRDVEILIIEGKLDVEGE